MTGRDPIDVTAEPCEECTHDHCRCAEKAARRDPIATIREALALHKSMRESNERPTARSEAVLTAALSALAEVEQQLADAHSNEDDAMRGRDNYESLWRMQRDRVSAAEAALANCEEQFRVKYERMVEAEAALAALRDVFHAMTIRESRLVEQVQAAEAELETSHKPFSTTLREMKRAEAAEAALAEASRRRNELERKFRESERCYQLQRERADDLADALRACDRYINWHQPRIEPTEECPDQETALKLARAALDRHTRKADA